MAGATGLDVFLFCATEREDMIEDVPETARRAFENHGSVVQTAERFEITTTVFDGFVTASEGPKWKHTYTVSVYVPTLDAAATEVIGPAVLDGWRDTFERRLEDAPKATRASVELVDFDVELIDEELQITYSFEWGNERKATEIAKTFVEYVEGTYVEGLIPGYEYEEPVSDLITEASDTGQSGPPL